MAKYYYDKHEVHITSWTEWNWLAFEWDPETNEVGKQVANTWGPYDAHTNGGIEGGLYWQRGRSSTTTSSSRGSYIETIVAELGAYPTNGTLGGHWYVLGKRAFPDFKIRQNDQIKAAIDGWVRVNGQLRQIQQMWARVNGNLKEV